MNHWIIIGGAAVLIGAYVTLVIWARKKQQAFEEEYEAAKERHEMFVLVKRAVRKRPESGVLRFIRIKTYEIVGRMNVFQNVKGMQMSRMQTVTLHTTKGEYRKIEVNHSYRMDVAGNYIGSVVTPPQQRRKSSKKGIAAWSRGVLKGLFRRKEKAADINTKGAQRKAKKGKSK